jgi:hypothetical protein
MSDQMSFWNLPPTHCDRCGRRLTNPISIKANMGPVCRGKHGKDNGMSSNDFVDLTIFDPIESGIILRREGEQTYTNIPHLVTHHSPTGYEWGYGGSGPADLALNICEIVLNRLDYQGERTKCFDGYCWGLAFQLHQEFKFKFIATANRNSATIPYAEVEAWVKEKMAVRA